ncbi:MAG TPA: DUF4253 domain-containing protein [Chloroflexia bacterium]|nr:DUF4253 domain-containing protein [Chloroflexia bacterium]
MSTVKEVLQKHGIETVTMQVLFGEGAETTYCLTTDGTSAIELWQKLRGLVPESGYWPVVVGGPENLDEHLAALVGYKGKATEAIIESSRNIDGQGWLRNAYEEDLYDSDEEEDSGSRGEWPAESEFEPGNRFTIPYKGQWLSSEQRMEYEPLPIVYIALVPTTASWQIPAYLKIGSWNYCPEPEEHCAVLRYWQERYGAEIVGLSYDTFELQVAQPLENREAALELAQEQYGYCPDIVDQGVATIEALAATLLNGHVWFFWWD